MSNGEASATNVFNATTDQFFDLLLDFNSYKEFVSDVVDVEINEQSETSASVTFTLKIVKTFSYTLRYEIEKPNRLTWKHEGGKLFKKNSGSWDIKEAPDGKTEGTYSVDVELALYLPGKIRKMLIGSNLPKFMENVQNRCNQLYT